MGAGERPTLEADLERGGSISAFVDFQHQTRGRLKPLWTEQPAWNIGP